LRRLAAIESDAGHHDEAVRYATEARVYAEDQGNKFDILQSIQAMAYALRNAGRLDEAYRAFEEYHHLRQMHSADYRTRVGTLEEMRGIRMTQRRYDEALELSRQMWPQKADGPVALSDVEHLGNVSRFALAAWKALHKADPTAPTPPELKLWTQADEAWAKIEAERKAPLP
jgi:tetratricopeptide (TPR) repeat protein